MAAAKDEPHEENQMCQRQQAEGDPEIEQQVRVKGMAVQRGVGWQVPETRRVRLGKGHELIVGCWLACCFGLVDDVKEVLVDPWIFSQLRVKGRGE